MPWLRRTAAFEGTCRQQDGDWQVLAASEEVTITTVPLGHGEEGHVPAHYLILRPALR